MCMRSIVITDETWNNAFREFSQTKRKKKTKRKAIDTGAIFVKSFHFLKSLFLGQILCTKSRHIFFFTSYCIWMSHRFRHLMRRIVSFLRKLYWLIFAMKDTNFLVYAFMQMNDVIHDGCDYLQHNHFAFKNAHYVQNHNRVNVRLCSFYLTRAPSSLFLSWNYNSETVWTRTNAIEHCGPVIFHTVCNPFTYFLSDDITYVQRM